MAEREELTAEAVIVGKVHVYADTAVGKRCVYCGIEKCRGKAIGKLPASSRWYRENPTNEWTRFDTTKKWGYPSLPRCPERDKPLPVSTATRLRTFWRNTIPEPNTGCLLWSGTINESGYGRFCNPVILAHRFSWLIHFGEIPAGMYVCHKCDTPACVNPNHLFIGTHHDNMRDKAQKGRAARACGENAGCHKLSLAQVREIRDRAAAGDNLESLSAAFGVSKQTVSKIISGLVWNKPDGLLVKKSTYRLNSPGIGG